MARTIRIGAGAGFAGDRIDPAVELARHGRLDYLVLECLAERTIALAQKARDSGLHPGYDPLLEERMRALLPYCRDGLKLITNMGAANPRGALETTQAIARELGIRGLRIAAIEAKDVREILRERDEPLWDTGIPYSRIADDVISADPYLGVEAILPALDQGADVVITGRVADPSLFLAPMVHAFGWRLDDWTRLGRGTVIGHLLECTGQVTGGYFADPGKKDVPHLARLGFPLAEVSEDGHGVITKVEGTGGAVTVATCKEQLLYEVHDPSSYKTPDVTADFSRVTLHQEGPDRVVVRGGDGRERPPTLKVTVGVREGYIGEGSIVYAGRNALARAQLARDILLERFQHLGLRLDSIRADFIGMNALHGPVGDRQAPEPYEVMLRVAAKSRYLGDAQRVGWEVEALWLNGPGGGGGARRYVTPVVAARATSIPRHLVQTELFWGD